MKEEKKSKRINILTSNDELSRVGSFIMTPISYLASSDTFSSAVAKTGLFGVILIA